MTEKLLVSPAPQLSSVDWLKIDRSSLNPPNNMPSEWGHVHYVSSCGEFITGLWRAQAGTLPIDCYPSDEHCVLISGEVVLTNHAGERQVYKAGDAFTVQAGFSGTWHMPVETVKYFAAHGPKDILDAIVGALQKN
jgi:uncharacterized cupin superfamily protein